MDRILILSCLLLRFTTALSSSPQVQSPPNPDEVEYQDYVYEERRRPSEEDFLEEDDYRKLGVDWPLYYPNIDQFWPASYYHYNEPIKHGISAEEFDPPEPKGWFPPRDLNGKTYNLDENGNPTDDAKDQWNKTVASALDNYDQYTKVMEEALKPVAENERLLARPYPFCVDGKLPRNRLPDPFKYREANKGGAYHFSNTDPHLERFIPILRTSLLRYGAGFVAKNEKAKPPIIHFENGPDQPVTDSYIQGIYFSEIKGPGMHGVGVPVLKQWLHMTVVSRIPLEGLYIQAIGYPMGLPFGTFRTDFDCDMGIELPPGLSSVDKVTEQNHQEFLKYWNGTNERIKGQQYHLRKRQEITVPCKYNHGDGVGEDWPNVFVYGGSVPTLEPGTKGKESFDIKWPPRNHFRMHFSYTNEHCGLIMRMQFLIVAVNSFAKMTYEQFLSPNYIVGIPSKGVGVATPFSPTWTLHNGGMKCPYPKEKRQQVVQSLGEGSDEGAGMESKFPERRDRPLLIYSSATAHIPIRVHGGYDNCIAASGIEEDYMILRSKTHTKHGPGNPPNATFVPRPLRHYGLNRSGLLPYDNCDKEKDAKKVECERRGRMYICPPSGHLCLNSRHGADKSGNKASIFQRTEADVAKFYHQHRTGSYLPQCIFQRCINPKLTEKIRVSAAGIGQVDPPKGKHGEDPCEVDGVRVDCDIGSINGAVFSENVTKKFYEKGSIVTRRAKGTHTWTMFLAWMTLMGIGTMTGRYYKETGGLNANAKNGVYGMGFWIWFHFLLFLSSLVFLWIGLLSDINIRRRPIPCNAYELYSGPGGQKLKDNCRYGRQVARVHRVFGYIATFLYHFALLTAWGRPMGNLKIKGTIFHLRTIGIWAHVVLAYLSKLICIVSVLMFFLTRAVTVCIDIPLWVVITQILSLALFAAGMVIQILEDRANRHIDKSNCPVPEAVEVADKGKCYFIKLGLIAGVVGIHLLFFLLLVISSIRIYGKSSREKPGSSSKEGAQGGFDTLKGIFSKCITPSLASEEDIKLERYFRSSDFRDS